MSESVVSTSLSKEELMASLLEKERAYYIQALELTRTEHEKFSSKRPLSEIVPIMKRKKVLLACIDEIETAMAPLKRHWVDKKSYDDRPSQKVIAELAGLDKIVKEILDLDLQSERMLEVFMLHLGKSKA